MNIKKAYSAMNPLEKWEFFRQIHCKLLQVVGVHFMDDKYKIHINTIFPIYLQLNYYILMVYTLFFYRNDLFHALISTTALGFFIPVGLLF